jgi:hypothetical protein
LFLIVWDVICDQRGTLPEPRHPFDPWWIGACGVTTEHEDRRYPWPAVQWPGFLDWAHLIDSWNDSVYQRVISIHSDISSEEHRLRGEYADALAYWYIEAVRSVAGNREMTTGGRLNANLGAADWLQLLANIAGGLGVGGGESSGPRWKAYLDWCKKVPLLAAPESGLRPAAAAVILDAAPQLTPKVNDLRALRRERLRFIGVPEDAIEAELQQIDARCPDHPWVTQIEQRRPVEPPSA